MRGLKIAAIAGGIACVVLVGGYFIFRAVVEQAGPAFEKSFNDSFLENCLKSAREAAAKQGRGGPDVDAAVQRRCNCALDVVKPLPASDKIALGNSEAKQREVLAEVQRRCQ
jgi:hypothetical protein